jgi:hypothetical protein
MNSVSSVASLFTASPLAASTNPLERASGAPQSASDGAATLFDASLDPRAARLLALGEGGAQRAQQARRVGELINEARSIVDRARYSASTAATVVGTAPDLAPSTRIDIGQGATVTVSDGDTTAVYTHAAGNTVEDFIAAINDTANLDVTVSLTENKQLRLEATGRNAITVGGSADDEELASLGLGRATTVGSANLQRQELARAFDAVRERIDAVGLATGDGAITAERLGIARVSAGGFQSDADLGAARTEVDRAEKSLAERFPARPDASRAAFTRAAVEVLSGGTDDLALAERDEASALGLARDVRSQLAATRRSLADGAAAQVLRLF